MQYLTVRELAELKGCSGQFIRTQIAKGKLPSSKEGNKHHIPLEAIEPKLQRKWYKQHGVSIPSDAPKVPAPPKTVKPLELYTQEQRISIDWWIHTLENWREFRKKFKPLSKADQEFVNQLYSKEWQRVSVKTLYRKWATYKQNDYDGLIDRRGHQNKGKSHFPEEIRDLFEYFYLDECGVEISKCLEAMKLHLKAANPELLSFLPSYHTARRWALSMPAPIVTLAREGEKAFDDRYGVHVDRLYDDMVSNDFWIADGHRIDVITRAEDGSERTHRLTLSAFIDARSGIYVGWVITDNPSSDATLLALRKAIRRYGIPKYIYVDNGREYLTYDIGGMGHRAKKRKATINLPTPILSRLGITMTNALPRNARAKTIEREFKNFTFLSRLFETYVGSNVVTKPEKLKTKLKNGRVPTDSHLMEVVENMIEGYFNVQPYGGKVVEDRGLSRMEVYKRHLSVVRKASDEDLNLMMMRSSRLRTVGANGVYITIGGEKLYYFDDELQMMAGKKVYIRYDPEMMDEVRIYDENEAFIKTAPLRDDIILSYFAGSDPLTMDGVKEAMAVKRRWHRLAKEEINIRREKIISQYGHINMLDIYVRAAKVNREGLLAIEDSGKNPVVQIVHPPEKTVQASTGTDGRVVQIDKARMIRNRENSER